MEDSTGMKEVRRIWRFRVGWYAAMIRLTIISKESVAKIAGVRYKASL